MGMKEKVEEEGKVVKARGKRRSGFKEEAREGMGQVMGKYGRGREGEEES
jgi:hypothetical protein